MLSMPSYIEKAKVHGVPPRFVATEDKFREILGMESPKILGYCVGISDRAKLALSAALVEWIVWRLDGQTNTEDALQFAESLWAAVVDFKYTRSIHHDPPYDQPLQLTLFYTWRKANAQLRKCGEGRGNPMLCVTLAMIARHVMPSKRGPFDKWLKWALESLFTRYELSSKDKDDSDKGWGVCVPMQALDPNVDFKPEMTNDIVKQFLRGLDYTENSYLRSPEEMLKMGFKGVPYRI